MGTREHFGAPVDFVVLGRSFVLAELGLPILLQRSCLDLQNRPCAAQTQLLTTDCDIMTRCIWPADLRAGSLLPSELPLCHGQAGAGEPGHATQHNHAEHPCCTAAQPQRYCPPGSIA